jgi:hypothetical protein
VLARCSVYGQQYPSFAGIVLQVLALSPWSMSPQGSSYWLPQPDRIVAWLLRLPLGLTSAGADASLSAQLTVPECDLEHLVSDRVAQVCEASSCPPCPLRRRGSCGSCFGPLHLSVNVNENVFSLGLSNATEEQQVYSAICKCKCNDVFLLMRHAYAVPGDLHDVSPSG